MSKFILLWGLIGCISAKGQSNTITTIPAKGADSLYVVRNVLTNDVRLFYGAQGNSLVYGSERDGSPVWQGSLYRNTNDFIGVGMTYKFIDFDLTFSLASTTYLKESRSNLSQFKFSASYTRRKFAIRAFVVNSEGFVVQGADSSYNSKPTVHDYRIGAQFTWIFNASTYSYAAPLYQNEIQRRSSGSFLLRFEPFYRRLGATESIAPPAYDLQSRFGKQEGLQYLYAPGILVLPGYAYTWSWEGGKYFVSPVICAGPGIAFNSYEGSQGKIDYVSAEYAASLLVSAGTNRNKWYGRIQINGTAGYIPLDPSYFTNMQLVVTLVAGFRFRDIEKFL